MSKISKLRMRLAEGSWLESTPEYTSLDEWKIRATPQKTEYNDSSLFKIRFGQKPTANSVNQTRHVWYLKFASVVLHQSYQANVAS